MCAFAGLVTNWLQTHRHFQMLLLLLGVEMCRLCGHRGKSSWSSPRNARGGRESQETRLLQTIVISAERVVPGPVSLFQEGEGGGKRRQPVQRLEVGKCFRGRP